MWNNIQEYLLKLPSWIWNLLLLAAAVVTGLLFKLLISAVLRTYRRQTNFSILRSAFKRLGRPLNYFLPLMILNILLPEMHMHNQLQRVVEKLVEICLTLSIAALLIGVVKIAEDYVYYKYDFHKEDNLKERKIRTQLQFIRRIVIGLIIVFALCIILLSFDSLRKVGAGLLTGVGISGIIIGFAAQKSLANLLAGFQIAFTQPLRIDDVIVVEGEWGRVEEITLTYVVLSIWDQRRLILPINYFIEKPFQNWTRNSTELLGAIFLYLDYSIAVQPLRDELKTFLKTQELWDGRVAVIQVTNTTDKSVELRILVSGATAPRTFDLRCIVREHFVTYIQTHFPESLPQDRLVLDRDRPNS